MGGISLGSAFFELNANSADLIREMAKAEAASKKSVEAISKATGVLEKDVQRLAQTYLRAETQRANASAQATLKIIKAYNDAGAAADKAAAQAAKGGEQSATAFLGAAKGAGAFAAAAIGVQMGGAALNNALTSVIENTRKLEQAQFAVNKLYGGGAKDITAFSEQLAKSSGRSRADALEAAAAQATLARQYALTSDQQKQVLQISADLAAVRGIPLAEATERVAAALRGEAEAAEYLGQVLNSDAVKAFAKMTDEQRKNFETLDPITKAQVVLGKLVGDNNDLTGAAAERTNTLTGSLDKLSASSENVGASIGQKLSPYLVPLIQQLSDGAAATDEWVKSWDLGHIERTVRLMEALNASFLTLDFSRVAAEIRRQQQEVLAAQAAGGVAFGPSPEEVIDTTARSAQLQARRRDALKEFVKDRKDAISDVADAREKAARAEAKAADDAIEREKTRLEVEKEGRLKALEARERATIRAIEAEQRAEEKAAQANLERLEREKTARLAAAEAARDQAEKALEDEARRLDRVREVEDRAVDDARKQEDRAVEDQRRQQDRARENTLRAEIDAIEKRRDFNVASIEAEIEAAEKATEKRLRALDREADRARANSEQRIRGIEKQADAEDDRHRAEMQRLDDEQDARLKIIDAQLKALDLEERQLGAARKISDLKRREADAQKALTLARGTGTPEQIAAARGDLTNALRVGDEVSIANARERLVKLAGQGNEAIKKADEELADVQEEIRQQGIDQTRDAEREQIKLKQDAIKDEINARKRAEDERNRERKRDLDSDKQAEQDRLKTRLAALEKGKQAAQDRSKEEIKLLRNTLEEEKKAAQASVEAVRQKFDDQKQALDDARRDEDRQRDDRRQKEDQDRDDFREAEDERLRLQKEAVEQAYEDERKATEQHYNGANGLVTQARKAQEAMKEAHRLRLDDAKLKFQAEQDAIKAVYRNTEKTGLLDLQDKAAENNKTKLDDQLKAIEEWKKDANKYIEENTGKWRDLEKAIKDTEAAIKGLPKTNVQAPNAQGGYGSNPYLPPDPGGNQANPDPIPPPPVEMVNPGGHVPVVRGINDVYPTVWTSAGTHGGNPAVDMFANRGTPIYAPVSGRMRALSDSKGGNAAILYGDDGRAYYFAHGNVGFTNGAVRQGQPVGEVGNTGNARGASPHLHFAIGSSAAVFGNLGGSGDIQGDSSWWTRDGGYLFTEPTMTVGMRTGARNLIAERRPELLVSGARTASLIGSGPRTDYGRMSELAAAAHPGGASGRIVNEGDVNFYGLTYEQAEARQRSQQRRKSLLNGVGRAF